MKRTRKNISDCLIFYSMTCIFLSIALFTHLFQQDPCSSSCCNDNINNNQLYFSENISNCCSYDDVLHIGLKTNKPTPVCTTCGICAYPPNMFYMEQSVTRNRSSENHAFQLVPASLKNRQYYNECLAKKAYIPTQDTPTALQLLRSIIIRC